MTAKKTSGNSSKSDQGQIQTIEPGFLTTRASVKSGVSGKPDDSDMGMINKLSRSGSVDPATIYRFDCVPSTQQIDSYYTRMDVSSLLNYAEEARMGTPVLNSHRSGGWGKTSELPIGRSFNGSVESDPENAQMQRFVASAYMLRNNQANGTVNTDDIIAAIEAGTVSDISIGFSFSPGTPEKNFTDRTILKCSICGNDFLRSDPWSDGGEDNCNHWPGELYKTDGGKKSELCVLDVVNAHLSEFSTVYSGATPGAVILKAQRAASEGLLDRVMIHRLEDTYRTRLMDYAAFPVPVIGANQDKDKDQTRKEKTEEKNITIELKTDATEQAIKELKEETKNIAERIDNTMANKRELEDAGKEGAKLALANLAKSIMSSRAFSDDELALFPEIETRLAAGDMDLAQSLITRLMLGTASENEEAPEDFYQSGSGEEGDGESSDRGDVGAEEEGGQNQGQASSTAIISMALTANERQQFQATREENARLKREIAKMEPFASLGEQRVAEVIDETMASYGRAGLGDGEEIKEMLVRMPYEQIINLRNQYETIAQKLFTNPDGSTGRQTTPADANSPGFAQGVVAAIEQNHGRRNDYGAYK
jgi:hypothetical protein